MSVCRMKGLASQSNSDVVASFAKAATCPTHPRYQKKGRPRSTCAGCWFLYFLTRLGDGSLGIEIAGK